MFVHSEGGSKLGGKRGRLVVDTRVQRGSRLKLAKTWRAAVVDDDVVGDDVDDDDVVDDNVVDDVVDDDARDSNLRRPEEPPPPSLL